MYSKGVNYNNTKTHKPRILLLECTCYAWFSYSDTPWLFMWPTILQFHWKCAHALEFKCDKCKIPFKFPSTSTTISFLCQTCIPAALFRLPHRWVLPSKSPSLSMLDSFFLPSFLFYLFNQHVHKSTYMQVERCTYFSSPSSSVLKLLLARLYFDHHKRSFVLNSLCCYSFSPRLCFLFSSMKAIKYILIRQTWCTCFLLFYFLYLQAVCTSG